VGNKLFFGFGALLFAGVAAFGIATGRFRMMRGNADPYLRRRESPLAFWTYGVLLIGGATVLAYIAIFVAR
jgi:hypothetical protein